MLDVISRGAQGHGPVHLLLTSAAELDFAWDGEERGWVRSSLPPVRMTTLPVQHFFFFRKPGSFVFLPSWLRDRGFGVLIWLMLGDLYNYLTLPD